MLTSQGRVKVLDFGVAKLGAAPSGDDHEDGTRAATLTSDGVIVGTVPYMSPEQLQDLPDRQPQRSLLAGCVVVRACGWHERPFVGGNAAAVASSILRDRPAPLVEVRANVPHELSRIVAHCLRKDPLERYQTARDVYNDLRELRRELESGSRGPLRFRAASPNAFCWD